MMDEAIGVINELKSRGYSATTIVVTEKVYELVLITRYHELRRNDEVFLLGCKVITDKDVL